MYEVHDFTRFSVSIQLYPDQVFDEDFIFHLENKMFSDKLQIRKKLTRSIAPSPSISGGDSDDVICSEQIELKWISIFLFIFFFKRKLTWDVCCNKKKLNINYDQRLIFRWNILKELYIWKSVLVLIILIIIATDHLNDIHQTSPIQNRIYSILYSKE